MKKKRLKSVVLWFVYIKNLDSRSVCEFNILHFPKLVKKKHEAS